MVLAGLILVSLLATVKAAAVEKRWAEQCTSFILPTIPEGIMAKITNATYYPAGAQFNETDINSSYAINTLPAFCRLQLNITTYPGSGAKSEVWLPDGWNNRFIGVANGGSGGGIGWGDLAQLGVSKNFACHATNGGHSSNSSSAVFAQGNPDALIDWNYRALHQGTVAAKAIIPAYYSQSSFTSYFAGCSAGGRQAWIEAERFPNDYDANDSIIAGAAAIDDIRQSAMALWSNQKFLPVNGSTWFSNASWNLVHAEVNRQCDLIDGVEDGVLFDPTACKFRPGTLACRPGQTFNQNKPECLTEAMIDALKYAYEPWVDTNNSYVYPGFVPGGEVNWIFGNFLPDGGQWGQDAELFRHFVYNDSNWRVNKTFDFSAVQLALATVAAGDSATNPDISAFVARGGKMLQYSGWNDLFISPLASVRWYEEVDKHMSTHTNFTTDDYYKLLLIPGMSHCLGGDGPYAFGQPEAAQYGIPPVSNDPQHNIVSALVDWYENDKVPALIGSNYVNSNPALGIKYQRPLCAFPNVTHWDGKGDTKLASSFYCAP